MRKYTILEVNNGKNADFYLLDIKGRPEEAIPNATTYPEAIRWVRSKYKTSIRRISLR